MKRYFVTASFIFLICMLALTAVFLTGCGKDQDDSFDTAPSPVYNPTGSDMSGGAQPGAPAMPTPGYPSMPSPTGGMPTPIGGQPGVPTAAAPTAVPSPGGGSGAIDAIEFSQVPLKSAVQKTTITSGGASLSVLKFKYEDYSGAVHLCEMPEAESRGKRSLNSWLSTFDLYKKESASTSGKQSEKSKPKHLDDFPFVAPPPAAPSSGGDASSPSMPSPMMPTAPPTPLVPSGSGSGMP